MQRSPPLPKTLCAKYFHRGIVGDIGVHYMT
jgi:hypothetical protein